MEDQGLGLACAVTNTRAGVSGREAASWGGSRGYSPLCPAQGLGFPPPEPSELTARAVPGSDHQGSVSLCFPTFSCVSVCVLGLLPCVWAEPGPATSLPAEISVLPPERLRSEHPWCSLPAASSPSGGLRSAEGQQGHSSCPVGFVVNAIPKLQGQPKGIEVSEGSSANSCHRAACGCLLGATQGVLTLLGKREPLPSDVFVLGESPAGFQHSS